MAVLRGEETITRVAGDFRLDVHDQIYVCGGDAAIREIETIAKA